MSSTRQTLRAAVIGLWGHEVYAQEAVAHPAVELVAVGGYPGIPEDQIARIRKWGNERGAPYVATPESLLDTHKPDICIVMCPPRVSAHVVVASLNRSIPTLAEKPFAANLNEVGRIATVQHEKDVPFSTCLPLPKHAPAWNLTESRVRSGEVGRPLQASFTYLASHGPLYIAKGPHFRDTGVTGLSGGEAAMFSGYGIATLEWLTGQRIETVFARSGSFFYPEYQQKAMEDMLSATLKFGDGIVGTLTVGRTPAPTMPSMIRFSVTGTKGQIFYDSREDNERIDIYDKAGPRSVSPVPPWSGLSRDFVEAVLQDRSPRLTATETFSTLEVLSALYRSAEAGREVKVERV